MNPLKNFSMAEESPTHFHLAHPNGHVLSLEKSKLSPQAHDFVRKACGGSVQGLDEGGQPAGTNTVLAANENTPAWTPPVGNGADMPNPQSTSVQSAPEQAAPPPGMAQASPQTAAANVPPEPLTQAKSEQMDLLNKQGANADTYMKTLQDVGANQQQAYQQQIDQMSKMKTPDQIMADYKAKDDQLTQHIMESKVDPNRLWSNASTGQKVVASIGLILSGMGAGANGQNMAAQTLNNAINRDIQQQQTEQSKQMNLWKMNREAMGSDLQANLATRNQMLSMTQAKIAQSASTLTNTAAQQQAQNAIFQIEQEKINTRRALAMLTPQQGGAGGPLQTNPLDVVRTIVPPDKQEAVAKEVGHAMDVQKSKDSMLQAFDQASKDTRPFTGMSGTSIMNLIPNYHPQSINSLASATEPMIKDVDGKINEITKSTAEANFPALGDSDARIAAKRKTLENMADERSSSPLFRNYTGMDLNHFSRGADNPVYRQPQQVQQYYAYAKAHPEQQVSQDFFAKHPEFK